jgi:hypothetical protein
MSQDMINLLLQIPLAGVVVVVVIVFLRFIAQYNTGMMSFLSSQTASMQSFIKEQRLASNESIEQLAAEIKGISQEVARMNGVLSAHDAASKVTRKR